jgi:hypothetical protein
MWSHFFEKRFSKKHSPFFGQFLISPVGQVIPTDRAGPERSG